MSADLLEQNIRSAAIHGWHPSDFGCDNFDADLIGTIEQFQLYHFLEPTKTVGPQEIRVLQEISELGDDAYEEMSWKQIRNSGVQYHPKDPIQVARRPFLGNTVWTDVPIPATDYHIDQVISEDPSVLGKVTCRRMLEITDYDPAKAASIANRHNLDGAAHFFDVTDLQVEPSEIAAKWREGTERPIAAIAKIPRGGSLDSHHHRPMYDLAEGFPVIFLASPDPRYPTTTIDVQFGWYMTCLRMTAAGLVRPSSMLPMIIPSRVVRPGEIHMLRRWCDERSVMGIGYACGMLDPDLSSAFFDPLPDRIENVNAAIVAHREDQWDKLRRRRQQQDNIATKEATVVNSDYCAAHARVIEKEDR